MPPPHHTPLFASHLHAFPACLSVQPSLRPSATQAPPGRMKCYVLVTELRLTLCDLMDCSPPGSSVHGIPQARILDWVAMPSSRGSSQLSDRTEVSCIAGKFFTN